MLPPGPGDAVTESVLLFLFLVTFGAGVLVGVPLGRVLYQMSDTRWDRRRRGR